MRWARPLLLLTAFATLGLAALAGMERPQTAAAAPANAEPKEKGAYLVRLAGCNGCHGQNFAGQRANGAPGAPFGIALGGGTIPARNITPDSDTGIGRWTDQQLMNAIRDGIRPDGTVLAPAMPYGRFHAIPDDEMLNIIAFLRSNPPVNNLPPTRRLAQDPAVPRFAAPSPQSSTNEGVARGTLLVSLAGCTNCHTPRLANGQADTSKNFAGSILPPRSQLNPGPDPEVVANITPDPNTGIGDWNVDQIARTITTGRRPNNTLVKGLMDREVKTITGFLSDTDARSIGFFLKSIPAVMYRADDPAMAAAPTAVAPAAPAPAAPAPAPSALPRTGDGSSLPALFGLSGLMLLLAGGALTLARRRS